jgi:hypothetical protein
MTFGHDESAVAAKPTPAILGFATRAPRSVRARQRASDDPEGRFDLLPVDDQVGIEPRDSSCQ